MPLKWSLDLKTFKDEPKTSQFKINETTNIWRSRERSIFFLRSKLKGIRSRGQTIEGFHLNSTSNLVLGKTDWATQDIRKAIFKLHTYMAYFDDLFQNTYLCELSVNINNFVFIDSTLKIMAEINVVQP